MLLLAVRMLPANMLTRTIGDWLLLLLLLHG
jgi:hypothetical protein